MRTRCDRPIAALIAAGLCGLVWSFSPVSAAGTIEQPFERVFAKFNATAQPGYRAFRHMEAGISGSDKQGSLDAWTEYSPAGGFRFQVVREDGSEYVRNKVLRKLLLNEQELLAQGKPLRAALAPRNYAFEDGGMTDTGLMRVILNPIRQAEGVVDGVVLVNPNDNGIVRMEGRLVKSPSFWVRDVDVAWKFAHIGEHVVPTELRSTGRVRFYGRSYFRMTYQYDSIDGNAFGLNQ